MQQIISLLQPVAPVLAQVLDSPFHALAKKYILSHLPDALADTGVEDEAQILALLSEPAGLHVLKDLDQKFTSEIRQLGLDLKFVKKARSEASLDRHRRNSIMSPQFLLSLVFVIAYFCIVFSMFFIEASDSLNMLKGENSFINELQILLGALTAGVGQVLSYWFGRGQEKKQNKPADNV
jgi:hypothetical protein